MKQLSRVAQSIVDERWLLRGAAVVLMLLVVVPLLVMLLGWREQDGALWETLWQTGLLTTLIRTVVLAVVVALLATLLGGLAALAVALFEFPMRRTLQWLLPLPLAVPAYVLAFIYVGMMESPLGLAVLPGFREHWGVFVVLVLAFYPYAYLLVTAALSVGGVAEQVDLARTLGQRFWPTLRRVVLPALGTACSGALALTALETLADFGAVATFNYDTLTTVVVTTWHNFYNLPVAMQLASLLLLLAALTVLLEQRGRRMLERPVERPVTAHRSPRFGIGLALLLFLLPALGLFIPLAQLLVWGLPQLFEAWPTWRAAGYSLMLGGLAALLVSGVGALLAIGARRSPGGLLRLGERTVLLGYAVPGTVMAIGVLSLLVPLGLVGSLMGLLFGYIARFCGPAVRLLTAASHRLSMVLEDRARLLGTSRAGVLWRLWFPALHPALLAAGVLVSIEVIKEMPMTLILRAPGWDTLAVRLYAFTSEGEWERAAAPGLLLIVLCLLPVWLLRRGVGQTV